MKKLFNSIFHPSSLIPFALRHLSLSLHSFYLSIPFYSLFSRNTFPLLVTSFPILSLSLYLFLSLFLTPSLRMIFNPLHKNCSFPLFAPFSHPFTSCATIFVLVYTSGTIKSFVVDLRERRRKKEKEVFRVLNVSRQSKWKQ